MGRFIKFIKSFDEHGHQVKINFNRNGNTVNTLIGGILSFVLRWFLRIFLVFKIIDVYSRHDTSFLSIKNSIDVHDLDD